MDAVKYFDYVNGEMVEKECTEYTNLSEALTSGSTLTAGWYVLDRDVTASQRIECSGDVHLILVDSTTLDATSGGIGVDGISNATLTLYAQTSYEDDPTGVTMGKLNATSTSSVSSGIGGTSTGHYGGTITINGGKITVNGKGFAAGIGGANQGHGGIITIHNGIVTATGGTAYAAGIGGGAHRSGGNITITGGKVSATGNKCSAGIGGGAAANGSNAGDGGVITITGGDVIASSGKSNTADIGGGGYWNGTGKAAGGGTITITGGKVTANNGGIGGSGDNTTGTLTIGWADDGTSHPSITTKKYQISTLNIVDDGVPQNFARVGDTTETPITLETLIGYTETTTIEPINKIVSVKYGDNTLTEIRRGVTSYKRLETENTCAHDGNITILARPSIDPNAKFYAEADEKAYKLTEDGTYTLPTNGKYMKNYVQVDYIRG